MFFLVFSKESIWWYNTFAMLVVNNYVLWSNVKATDSVANDTAFLKQFMLHLCDELLVK